MTDKEKYDYVSRKYLLCTKSFGIFKEGQTYWLEYLNSDVYIGRSDNILNIKTTITEEQLLNNFKPIRW